MKRISILGCTGSIGTQTIDVVNLHKKEFKIVALCAGNNIDLLRKQIKHINPEFVAVAKKEDALQLSKEFKKIKFGFGQDGIKMAATFKNADMIVNGLTGFLGLVPTLDAIKAKKDVALANKETIVVAGKKVMALARKNNVNIIPVDSEHSAIFQSLRGENYKDIKKIILTASGGALRDWKNNDLKNAKLSDVLKHPNWAMGQKITIDSATMFNKALEIIEARWLFNTKEIDVLIHRESIIHSMVTMNDNSTLAQLGVPSMTCPIQYALAYPNRMSPSTQDIDWTKTKALNFELVDVKKYPAVELAYVAIEKDGTMPTVLNAANEKAVELFVAGKIKYIDIAKIVKKAMDKHILIKNPSIKQIIETDAKIRKEIGDQYA